jgi:hypothetical protein
MPALLMSTSRRPNSVSTEEKAALMEVLEVTSSCRSEMVDLTSSWDFRSDRAFWPFSRERLPMMTW